MKVSPWLLGGGLLLGVGLFGFGWYWRGQEARRQAAADQATIASHEGTIARLRAAEARLDTIYKARTDTFRLWRQRWDTVRTLERFTDTLIHRDTVRIIVATAEATVAACELKVATCEEQRAVLRSTIVEDSSTIRSLSRQLQAAKFRNRIACAVGPSYTLNGPAYAGVSCGLRIF